MVKISILIITIISLLSSITSYDNPSLVYALNESQLKELEKIVIEKFLLNKELPIQDYHFKEKIDFIGTVQLDILQQKFKFNEISTESMNIEFIDTNKITFNIKDVKAQMNFNYDFQSNFYSNKGSGTILLNNANVALKNKMTSVANTLEPTKMGPCFEIEKLDLVSIDMDIKFNNEGQLEKILKGILLNLKNAIIETIQKKFNDDYIFSINDSIKSSFAKMKLLFNVPATGLTISYSMQGIPEIQKKVLTSAFNVEIYDANYKYDQKPYSIPPIVDTLNSIDLLLNQFIFENYLYIMYKENKLNWEIKSEATGVLPLTVKLFQDCFPKIIEKYTNDEPIDLKLIQLDRPKAIFKEKDKEFKGQTQFILDTNIEFTVRKDGKSEVAVAGNSLLEINFELELKEGKILCNLTALEFKTFTPTQSIIGEINPNDFLNGTKDITELLLPIINAKIENILKDLVLPSFMGIKFDHSDVTIHNNYLQVGISPYLDNSWFALFK